MELNVYDWEKFERTKIWYLVFGFFILLIVVLSILSKNVSWWIFLLILAGCYVFFTTKPLKTIKMITWKKTLQIDKLTYPRETLKWFVLEYHLEKKKIHNIVIIDNKNTPRIYTINDSEKNLQDFVNDMNGYIPMLDKYDQTTLNKVIRKFKL